MRIRLPRGEWIFDPNQPLGPPGGFGEVFAGTGSNNELVAVKRLKVSAQAAAHRELRIADDLAGKAFEHVLTVFDAGEDSEGGGYFIIMPRAERSLLDELKIKGGKLTPAESVDILSQIAQGLVEVKHLVHRDLKPGNVLLHDAKWKIADFGIARFVEEATSANTVRGCLSPQYAAPEQWIGEHATGATDVYALSCVAYQLFSGKPPFQGPGIQDFQQQHRSADPPALNEIDPRLRAILIAGLRKPQAGRPPIDRVLKTLSDVLSNPKPQTPALAALQDINAEEAERVSAAAAEAARVRRAQEERHALTNNGLKAFQPLVDGLRAIVSEHLPEAHTSGRNNSEVAIAIRNAVLRISRAEPTKDSQLPGINWNLVAISQIGVEQGEPNAWQQSATLWYMRLSAETNYRWYEVSYKWHVFANKPLRGPFAIQEAEGRNIYRDAGLAASPGMHLIEIASGPVAIDDENSDQFIERWLALFAQAYQGRLRPF